MKKPKVSVIIPVYKPDLKILKKLRNSLKEQTIKAEVIENWNMPEAKSMNRGIKKAKGEIVITLAQDCIPEDKFWLEKLIKPLENKKIAATISDLYLPKEHWRKYSFLTRILTIKELNPRKNWLDCRGCAYRKEDLLKIGLFNENPKVIGIDLDLSIKLEKKGKFINTNLRVFHLHKLTSFKEVIKRTYNYSESNGKAVRQMGWELGRVGLEVRILKSLPIFGAGMLIWGFPFKEYFYLFPAYVIIAVPLMHFINLIGFWKGFFIDKESIRNLEVLKK